MIFYISYYNYFILLLFSFPYTPGLAQILPPNVAEMFKKIILGMDIMDTYRFRVYFQDNILKTDRQIKILPTATVAETSMYSIKQMSKGMEEVIKHREHELSI